MLVTAHRLTADLGTAAGLALGAGMDSELPRTAAYGDAAARRRSRMGGSTWPDRPRGRPDAAPEDPARPVRAAVRRAADAGALAGLDADEHSLALDLARRSIVLLENDGTLPLASSVGANRGHRTERRQRARPARRLRPPRAHRDAPRDARRAKPFGFPRRDVISPVDELAAMPTILDALRDAVRRGAGRATREGRDLATAPTTRSRRRSRRRAAPRSRSRCSASDPG